MINETLQWIMLGGLTILVLGMLRHFGQSSTSPTRSTQSGPRVGSALPRVLLQTLRAWIEVGQDVIVVFVSEGCTPCGRLLSELQSAGPETLAGVPVVVIARSASGPFEESLIEGGFNHLIDEGTLFAAAHVTTTPLVIRADAAGKVISKAVTADVNSFASA